MAAEGLQPRTHPSRHQRRASRVLPTMRPPSRPLSCPGCGAAAEPDATRCGYCSARLATVACPHCFAPTFVGSRHCAQCGTRAARQEEQAAEQRCPACRDPMQVVRIGALETLECARCEGLWLEAAAFERLCADGEAQAAALQWEQAHPPGASMRLPVRYRPCPSCGKFMNRVNFGRISGVVLDVCRTHGAFFDRSELHGVIAFVRGGGLERSRQQQREQLAEEQRRLAARQAGERMASLVGPKVVLRDELQSAGVRLDFETLIRVFGAIG